MGDKQVAFAYSHLCAVLFYNRSRRLEMKKQEKQIEVEVNGTPDLSKESKDLLQLFCEAMLKEMLSKKKEKGR